MDIRYIVDCLLGCRGIIFRCWLCSELLLFVFCSDLGVEDASFSGGKSFDGSAWGTFDANDDVDSAWGPSKVNSDLNACPLFLLRRLISGNETFL